jgi:hypothetical protein
VALGSTFTVVGEVSSALVQVVYQLVEFFYVFGLGPILFQAVDGLGYLSLPEMGQEQRQQLGFGLTPVANQTGQVVAFLAAMIPVQDQRSSAKSPTS